MAEQQLAPSSTYPEDVVRIPGLSGGPDTFALVLRCWEDERGPEVAEEAARRGIPFTPLEPGTLEVLHPSGITTQILESSVTVTDRGFLNADLVRASGGKGQAGIITHLSTTISLQRILSGEAIEGTFDAKEVVAASRIVRNDHVVYGDWVGLVEEVFEMALVETRDGAPRRVCDSGSTLSVGATSENFFLDRLPTAADQNPADLQRVLDVKQIVVAVNWLCTNQRGTVTDFNRPKRYWTDPSELSLVRGSADHLHSVGDKVIFRDQSAHPLPAHLSSSPHSRGHQVCVITNSTTTVSVLWQDGTTSIGPAPSFEHCLNIDEEVDAFPGDMGMFSGCTPPRVAVVQSMKSKQRTVKLRFYGDEGEEETVSGLEFDQHGPPPEVYGVRRGDYVLVTREGEGNGVEIPTVPRLGESEVATGAFPPPDLVRVEISQIGLNHAATLPDPSPSLSPKTDPTSLSSINWYGEVVDLLLDGRVTLRFPSGVRESFPLDRIYLLDDGLGPGGEGEEGMMEVDGDGNSAGSWETDEEGEGGEGMPGGVDWGVREADEQDEMMSESEGAGWAEDVEEEESGLEVKEIVSDEEKKEGDEESVEPQKSEEKGQQEKKGVVSMPAEVEDDENWKRFLMLEEAPSDHYYASQPPIAPSKAFMSRVQKEHNVLASSLPPNILVRAYEDRADLLRCLIIGPLGTPFANAPFLFDVFLSPTKFPAEPPLVHFHSWAGGTRVSPNLYAEGKVCLSLLNTWHGDKTESWSAGRSSILQVFISIQALIMTENPYYSEPGFEKQQGTMEGTAASDLYNERTLVLTRAFVKRACEYPPKDFEAEVRAYYYDGLPTTGPGALAGIVEQAKALLQESEQLHALEKEEEEADKRKVESRVVEGLMVLTEGASLSLKRTLKGLEPLLEKK